MSDDMRTTTRNSGPSRLRRERLENYFIAPFYGSFFDETFFSRDTFPPFFL